MKTKATKGKKATKQVGAETPEGKPHEGPEAEALLVPEVVMVGTGLINRSPFQARTIFPEEEAKEMADSVRRHGVLQPLLCRLVEDRYELVAGERRWRAALEVGLASVPVIVRDLTDTEAEELGLVENLKRKDLSPLEEAEGYARLKRLKGDDGRPLYTDERIAERLGVSLSRVRQRLQLRRVPQALLDAVTTGEVSTSTAALVGRIPDEKSRAAAVKDVLKPMRQEIPLNYEQTKELLRERYMIKLSRKDFDLEDATLLPIKLDEETGARLQGGACEDCPWRSGRNEEIQDELALAGTAKGGSRGGATGGGLDPNLCTNPGCHRLKLDQMWKRRKVEATEQGLPTIEGKEAKEIFSGYEGRLPYNSKYAQMDDKPEWGDFNEHDLPKWRSLLKSHGVTVTPTLVRHPETGKAVELIVRKDAVEAVKSAAKALVVGEKGEVKKGPSEKEKAAKKAERDRQRLAVLEGQEAVSAIMEAVAAKGWGDAEVRRCVFGMALDAGGADGASWMGKFLEVEAAKGACGRDYCDAVWEHVEAVAGEDAEKWLGFAVAAQLARSAKWGGAGASDVQESANRLGVDLAAVRARAKERLKAESGSKGKKAKRETAGGKDAAADSVTAGPWGFQLETTRWGQREAGGGHALEEDGNGGRDAGAFFDWDDVLVCQSGEVVLRVHLAEYPEAGEGDPFWYWGWSLESPEYFEDSVPRRVESHIAGSREQALVLGLDACGARLAVWARELGAGAPAWLEPLREVLGRAASAARTQYEQARAAEGADNSDGKES